MSLQAELDARRMAWEAQVGESIARLIAGDIEALRDTGILDRAAKPGEAWPAAPHLLDAQGKAFDLAALAATKPVVVTYYRGGWCPYCNLELRAYQARLAEFRALGAELVAISFETPDAAQDTAMKNDLIHPVLSDVGGALASALGIRFTLSEALRPFYEQAGHALPDRNGDGSWALPLPATFVIAPSMETGGGTIAAAFVKADYRHRTDPKAALAALRAALAHAA